MMNIETQEAPIAQDAFRDANDLVVITGMSGAGRTEAMHSFEDMGYFCIDNLPASLLPQLLSVASNAETEKAHRLAVVCDARNKGFFEDLGGELERLRERGIAYRVVFLDAADEKLVARYKASRRRHPLCEEGMTIAQGITAEREIMMPIRAVATDVVDTTDLMPMQLRKRIAESFDGATEREGLSVTVYSFGFKHAAPADADIVIDVRFLPNPYYDKELRSLTGLDAPVYDYVIHREETQEFLVAWCHLLDSVMPGYVSEGKQQLAIAVGCTGGQHRSVAIAEFTGSHLKMRGYRVSVTHRDLSKAESVASALKSKAGRP